MFTLQHLWENETNQLEKEKCGNIIANVCRRLKLLLEDTIFPLVNLDTVLLWIKLKQKCHVSISVISKNPTEASRAETIASSLDVVFNRITTTTEILDLPVWDNTMLQLALNYSTYCCSILHNPVRAFRIATTTLRELEHETNVDPNNEKQTQLVEDLKVYLQQKITPQSLKVKCDKLILQGYLRKKESPTGDFSLPIWCVFGYWDFHTFIFQYESTQFEEAKEILLIPENVNVLDEGDHFLINGFSSLWYYNAKEEKENWFSALLTGQLSQENTSRIPPFGIQPSMSPK